MKKKMHMCISCFKKKYRTQLVFLQSHASCFVFLSLAGIWQRKDGPQQQLQSIRKVHPSQLPGEWSGARVSVRFITLTARRREALWSALLAAVWRHTSRFLLHTEWRNETSDTLPPQKSASYHRSFAVVYCSLWAYFTFHLNRHLSSFVFYLFVVTLFDFFPFTWAV